MERADNPRSQADVDLLLRELWEARRLPAEDELHSILAHLAAAPFGIDALDVENHVAKRVEDDAEWAASTTAEQYLSDLKAVFVESAASLYLFQQRGGLMVLGVAETGRILDRSRLGPRWKRLVGAFYSVDRGRMITGYQMESEIKRGIPEGGLWLKR